MGSRINQWLCTVFITIRRIKKMCKWKKHCWVRKMHIFSSTVVLKCHKCNLVHIRSLHTYWQPCDHSCTCPHRCLKKKGSPHLNPSLPTVIILISRLRRRLVCIAILTRVWILRRVRTCVRIGRRVARIGIVVIAAAGRVISDVWRRRRVRRLVCGICWRIWILVCVWVLTAVLVAACVRILWTVAGRILIILSLVVCPIRSLTRTAFQHGAQFGWCRRYQSAYRTAGD